MGRPMPIGKLCRGDGPHRPVVELDALGPDRLRDLVDRPNLLVKIPATVEGLPAITKVLAETYGGQARSFDEIDNAVRDAQVEGQLGILPAEVGKTWHDMHARERGRSRHPQGAARRGLLPPERR